MREKAAGRTGRRTFLETAYDANAPAWSPVDNRIAFWSGIENQWNNDDPSWSPDGTMILFSTARSGRNELWVMDADGRNQRKVHEIDAAPFPGRASWQPLTR